MDYWLLLRWQRAGAAYLAFCDYCVASSVCPKITLYLHCQSIHSFSARPSFKMALHSLSNCLLLSFTSLVVGQAIQFDGRVPSGTQVTAFDATNGLFNPANVFGANLSFSKILQLPAVQPSLFDVGTVPLEVTIKYVISLSIIFLLSIS